jgi:hypothetical protein
VRLAGSTNRNAANVLDTATAGTDIVTAGTTESGNTNIQDGGQLRPR